MEILTAPRNALVKQYQRMFELDGVQLEFEEDALRAIADLAVCGRPARAVCARSSKTSWARSCSTCPRPTTSLRSSSRVRPSKTARSRPSCWRRSDGARNPLRSHLHLRTGGTEWMSIPTSCHLRSRCSRGNRTRAGDREHLETYARLNAGELGLILQLFQPISDGIVDVGKRVADMSSQAFGIGTERMGETVAAYRAAEQTAHDAIAQVAASLGVDTPPYSPAPRRLSALHRAGHRVATASPTGTCSTKPSGTATRPSSGPTGRHRESPTAWETDCPHLERSPRSRTCAPSSLDPRARIPRSRASVGRLVRSSAEWTGSSKSSSATHCWKR